jgi:hypothetical protein
MDIIILVIIISLITYFVINQSVIVKCEASDKTCVNLWNHKDIYSKCDSLCNNKLNINTSHNTQFTKNADGSIDCECYKYNDNTIVTGKNVQSVEGKMEKLSNVTNDNFNEYKLDQYKRYTNLIFGKK